VLNYLQIILEDREERDRDEVQRLVGMLLSSDLDTYKLAYSIIFLNSSYGTIVRAQQLVLDRLTKNGLTLSALLGTATFIENCTKVYLDSKTLHDLPAISFNSVTINSKPFML
jgi:hypothetical protein